MASENDSFENISEVERWDSFITSHPKFILEKKNEEEQWKCSQNESIIKSFNIQKSIIPKDIANLSICLLYTSPSPRDMRRSRMPSSA